MKYIQKYSGKYVKYSKKSSKNEKNIDETF